MNTVAYPIELKFSGAALPGSFEGYASVFGVLDLHRDMIAPGAFKGTIAEMKARGFNVPLYLNHGARGGAEGIPAGVWDVIDEDDKGLAVKGRILGLETDAGRYKHELIKGGALRGISIGYRIPAGGATYGKTATEPRRMIKRVELSEISLVDNPSNHMASVIAIKSADEIKTIREFEDFLRDVGGFSNAAAKAIAAGGFKAQPDPRDEDGISGEAIAALIRRNIATLSRKD